MPDIEGTPSWPDHEIGHYYEHPDFGREAFREGFSRSLHPLGRREIECRHPFVVFWKDFKALGAQGCRRLTPAELQKSINDLLADMETAAGLHCPKECRTLYHKVMYQTWFCWQGRRVDFVEAPPPGSGKWGYTVADDANSDTLALALEVDFRCAGEGENPYPFQPPF